MLAISRACSAAPSHRQRRRQERRMRRHGLVLDPVAPVEVAVLVGVESPASSPPAGPDLLRRGARRRPSRGAAAGSGRCSGCRGRSASAGRGIWIAPAAMTTARALDGDGVTAGGDRLTPVAWPFAVGHPPAVPPHDPGAAPAASTSQVFRGGLLRAEPDNPKPQRPQSTSCSQPLTLRGVGCDRPPSASRRARNSASRGAAWSWSGFTPSRAKTASSASGYSSPANCALAVRRPTPRARGPASGTTSCS